MKDALPVEIYILYFALERAAIVPFMTITLLGRIYK